MKVVRDLTCPDGFASERWLVWRTNGKWLWTYSRDRASTFKDETDVKQTLEALGLAEHPVVIEDEPAIIDGPAR